MSTLPTIDLCQSRTIRLANGSLAIVDAEDYERIAKHRWHCTPTQYPRRQIKHPKHGWKKTIKIYLSREIMGDQSVMVDHINRNPLDNRKCNLRVCDRSHNQANRRMPKNNTSGFKGVRRRDDLKPSGRWSAHIGCNGREYYKNRFGTAKEAALWYDMKALELFGEFAVLNFPQTRASGKCQVKE